MEDWLLKGRMEKKLVKEAEEFLVLEDIKWDNQIVLEEILGSKAYAITLWKSKIISKDELKKILEALKEAENLWLEGKFKLKPEFEDVHLNIENFVVEKTGIEVGGKLHTGRSRNEQIILDLRLYLRKEINEIVKLTLNLTETFLSLAKKHLETVMPGYTHLQHAQPITFAHWLTAYTQMFLRDIERLEKTYQFINLCPIGASALAGTSWPIKRKEIAKLLGFDGFQENSLDVVTSRGEDLAEFFANLSILMVHLSRLMGDLMIWSTYEFRMVEFDDSYAMASSIMPQKKNPDIAELIRGKTSFTISQLQHTLYLMKGLPSGYFKDLQETKLAVFKLTEMVKHSLKIVKGVISTLKIDKQRMFELAASNFSTATDLVDLITRKIGIPFRLSYQIVGTLVKNAIKNGKKATEVGVEELKKASIEVTGKEIVLPEKEIKQALNPTTSIRLKKTEGGPNPEMVKKMIKKLEEKIGEKKKQLNLRIRKIKLSEEKLKFLVDSILKT